MTPLSKAQTVKRLARDVGFDLVGITPADPPARVGYYREWLARGYAGSMTYLHRNVLLRAEPARLLPRASAIICVALAYKRTDGYVTRSQLGLKAPGSLAPPDGGGGPSVPHTGRIAQYARGRDYHIVMHGMLIALIARLRCELVEPFEARAFVDTGPVLERELAARAGLGWIGRNTCLLSAQRGSYLLLGELVTTLDIAADVPLPGQCGSCTRCVDSCPTHALVAPYELDARRCIAYLTIEHRGDIAAELQVAIGERVFGCDVCQQVCPYNARAPLGTYSEIMSDRTTAELPLEPLIHLTVGGHRRLTRESALRRANRAMWQRNAAVSLTNATVR